MVKNTTDGESGITCKCTNPSVIVDNLQKIVFAEIGKKIIARLRNVRRLPPSSPEEQ